MDNLQNRTIYEMKYITVKGRTCCSTIKSTLYNKENFTLEDILLLYNEKKLFYVVLQMKSVNTSMVTFKRFILNDLRYLLKTIHFYTTMKMLLYMNIKWVTKMVRVNVICMLRNLIKYLFGNVHKKLQKRYTSLMLVIFIRRN